MVECGGLENRFTRNPGNEGSNPSSSAITESALPSERFFVSTIVLASKKVVSWIILDQLHGANRR